MTEIWNLSALCRCCHKDGHFKSLQTPDMFDDGVVMYCDMLRDTFGLSLKPPPVEASYCICDECIEQLRRAALFKRVVLACEHKFQEYCTNELTFSLNVDVTFEKPMVNELPFAEVKVEESFENVDLPCHLDAEVKVENEYSDADIVSDDGARDYDDNNIKVSNSPPPSSPEPLTRHALTASVSTEHGPVRDESTSNDVPTNNTDCMFMCEICYKLFNDKSLLETHQRTHAKLFTCDDCKKQFTLESYLITHQRFHTTEKPFSCDICKKRFKRKLRLIKHRCKKEKKTFFCDICKKQFSRKITLIRHKYSHTGEKPFCCNLCEKRFSRKISLIRHQHSHTGEKPFSCDICKKRFSQQSNVYRHQLSHTGEKPVSCDICKKQFTRKCSLIRHQQSHTGEKPFCCDICTKQYWDKSQLIRHQRTHTGEKPFTCDICKKQFSQKFGLIKHLRRHE